MGGKIFTQSLLAQTHHPTILHNVTVVIAGGGGGDLIFKKKKNHANLSLGHLWNQQGVPVKMHG